MFNLDFAFFNIMNYDRRGLLFQKVILERLAPLFFAPRVERLIDLPDLGLRGCSINLPLGPGNLSLLEEETRADMIARSSLLLDDFSLDRMAVDRRMKNNWPDLPVAGNIFFGDHFIKALASALVDRIVSRRELRKVVIVGEMDDMGAFAARICGYGIPVSIHSLHPARYEVLSYRLMYEKGCAVSTSYLEPHNWGRGDLVLIFDEAGARLSIQAPEAFCLCLNDSSKGWSPEIENNLARNGIDTALHNLAPIVETCLLAPEEGAVPDNEALKFTCLQERGQAMGLWDVFLEAPGVGSAAPSLS